MTRNTLSLSFPLSCALLGLSGCVLPIELSDGSSETTADPSGGPTTGTTTDPTVDPSSGDSPTSADSGQLDVPGADECTVANPCELDVLVVVDNSDDSPEAQRSLVRALVPLVETLRTGGLPVDVQIMFTTTDVGNPLCAPFNTPDYEPARGAPTIDGCNARINHFTGLGSDPDVRMDVCTASCPADVVPEDPFVAFSASDDNVPDAAPRDIDGDEVLDSAVAQAVACLAPQGINGCGYEAPLEAMHLALDPEATWNTGARPFLRPNSAVAIVLVTPEADCSIADVGLLEDPQYQQVDPASGQLQASGAVCWNAGVACDGPDADGEYSSCVVTDNGMQPLSRYTDRLVGELAELEGRRVSMIAITGVPQITARADDQPFEPIAGGEAELVIRDFRDGVFPDGDRLPRDVESGTSIAQLDFEYGIGPGCTAQDGAREIRGIPNPRVQEVCHALDVPASDDDRGVRCCVESICDPLAGLSCVVGLIDATQTEVPGE